MVYPKAAPDPVASMECSNVITHPKLPWSLSTLPSEAMVRLLVVLFKNSSVVHWKSWCWSSFCSHGSRLWMFHVSWRAPPVSAFLESLMVPLSFTLSCHKWTDTSVRATFQVRILHVITTPTRQVWGLCVAFSLCLVILLAGR